MITRLLDNGKTNKGLGALSFTRQAQKQMVKLLAMKILLWWEKSFLQNSNMTEKRTKEPVFYPNEIGRYNVL